MRMPDRVLALAGGLSHDLGRSTACVRRLDDGVPRAGDSPAAVRESIDALWDRLRRMRQEMRSELGEFRTDSGR